MMKVAKATKSEKPEEFLPSLKIDTPHQFCIFE